MTPQQAALNAYYARDAEALLRVIDSLTNPPARAHTPEKTMTKQVRIENADPSSWPVRVTMQHKNAEGVWEDQPSPVQLDYPTAMHETYITSWRRLIVEERSADHVSKDVGVPS
jgi:hypothetical protein